MCLGMQCLNKIVDKSCHLIRNSNYFVQTLQSFRLEPNDRMVSFDVVSPFTKVPIMEAEDIIPDLLHKDPALKERTDLPSNSITDLLKKCLTTTYFQYQDKYFQQKERAAMGSLLSLLTFSWRFLRPRLPRPNQHYGSDTLTPLFCHS